MHYPLLNYTAVKVHFYTVTMKIQLITKQHQQKCPIVFMSLFGSIHYFAHQIILHQQNLTYKALYYSELSVHNINLLKYPHISKWIKGEYTFWQLCASTHHIYGKKNKTTRTNMDCYLPI